MCAPHVTHLFRELLEQQKPSMPHPYAHTIVGFILALDVIARHSKQGVHQKYFLDAGHEIIYSYVTAEEVPEGSADGDLLTGLGWHLDSDCDCWSCFT